MPTSLAASFEKPCKETTVEEFVSRFSQQWNNIQRSEGQFFFTLNTAQKILIPKSVGKAFWIFLSHKIFFCDFFLFLAFYKTLLYLEYTTGLSYNASLTIIY